MKSAVKFLVVLILVFAACLLLASSALATEFQVGSRTYWVDGKPNQMDAAPFIENGRTYVPVRYLALALGVAEEDIGWDASSKTVTLKLENTAVKLVVGSETIYMNGQPRQMDVAPVIKNDRTYLPARWVAEAFGYEVKWEPAEQRVTLSRKGNDGTEPASPDTTIDGEKVAVYHYAGGVLSGVSGKHWYLSLSGQPRQLTITDSDTKQKHPATVWIPQLTITDSDTGETRTYDVASPDTWWGFPVSWSFPGTSTKKLSNDPVARKWIQDPVVVRFGLARVILGVIDNIAMDEERKRAEEEMERRITAPTQPYTPPTYTPTVPYTPPAYSPVQPWSPGGTRW